MKFFVLSYETLWDYRANENYSQVCGIFLTKEEAEAAAIFLMNKEEPLSPHYSHKLHLSSFFITPCEVGEFVNWDFAKSDWYSLDKDFHVKEDQ